jgi:hypothetical protein
MKSFFAFSTKMSFGRLLKDVWMQGARQWAPPEGWVFERSEEKS